MQDEQTKDKVVDQLVTDQMEPGEADNEDGIISTTGLVRAKDQVARDEEYVDRVEKVRELDRDLEDRSNEIARQRGNLPAQMSEEEIEEQRKAEEDAQKQLEKEREDETAEAQPKKAKEADKAKA